MLIHDDSLPLAASLDALSSTFTRDREFCEALAKAQPASTARVLVYCRWAQMYMPAIQEEMHRLVDRHFLPANWQDAKFWTLSLTGGINRDLGYIPYLALRGLIWEAGVATRRGLENVGLLAHLWLDPSTARFLSNPDSKEFRNAFVNEDDKAAARALKARGVQKRFAASDMDTSMSQLYRMVSSYSVHGASPNQLVTAQVSPTRLSCMFVNRPNPFETPLGSDLEIFGNACELLCTEVAMVFGKAAKKHQVPWSQAHEGGELLGKLMDRQSDVMSHYVEQTLSDLRWNVSPHS